MNANELADKLDSISYDCTIEEWRASPVGNAANMLRQQAQEIEELRESIKIKERDYNFMKDLAIGSENIIADKNVEIEKLKAEKHELSDEEIESEWFNIFKPETGIGKNITNGIYEFARAILKKASEK